MTPASLVLLSSANLLKTFLKHKDDYKLDIFLGGESREHPPILYEFNFGSLTNTTLREIERELTDVINHSPIKDLNSKRSKVSMFYSTKVPEY